MFEYFGVFLAFKTIRALPLSVLFGIAKSAALTIYIVPSFRKLLVANLKVAFPEKSSSEINALARKSFSNLVLSLLEFFWFMDKPERIEKHTVYKNETHEFTEKSISDGTGFIFVVPHLGNWELAGLLVSHFDNIPFAVAAREVRNPYLHNFVNSSRMIEGNRIIDAKGAIKGMMKALKDGCGVATLIDQNSRVRDGGIFVNFFGLPVPTSRAPALFARKLNVPVIVGGCIRKGKKYESFLKPLPKTTGEYKDDAELIQALMKITEDLVREHPEQYLWLYKRFQNIPKDADEKLIKQYPYYATITTEKFYDKPSARK